MASTKTLAFEIATRNLKSFSLGLLLTKGLLSATEAINFASVEQRFQMEKWGRISQFHDLEIAIAQKNCSAASFIAALARQID